MVKGPGIGSLDHGPVPLTVAAGSVPDVPELDPLRAFIFPNRIRELRRTAGFPKLMALALALPEMTYIRLSKIERGEVFPRAEELVRIAGKLGVAPADLLIDIDAAGFDLAAWAAAFQESRIVDAEKEREALLLAAALRARREQDRDLTLALIEKEYGIPPVILSRLEHAQKPLDRWNSTTLQSVLHLFGVRDMTGLRRLLAEQLALGRLSGHLAVIADAGPRIARSREKIAALRAQLAGVACLPDAADPSAEAGPAPAGMMEAMLAVFGAPLADGLIAETPTAVTIARPPGAGPRSYGLRVCRATLGPGLPLGSTLIVDPDRYPVPGGLAVLRAAQGLRVLAVTQDRDGALVGFSNAPSVEVRLDDVPPGELAAVIAAQFL